jgi:hypothetical protein
VEDMTADDVAWVNFWRAASGAEQGSEGANDLPCLCKKKACTCIHG